MLSPLQLMSYKTTEINYNTGGGSIFNFQTYYWVMNNGIFDISMGYKDILLINLVVTAYLKISI